MNTVVLYWDSGQTWDSGLAWDTEDHQSTTNKWLSLVTSAHQSAPKFMAGLQAVLQPLASMVDLLGGMAASFDLDAATGAQLDVVGQWVGASRNIAVPLENVWFAWGTSGQGWGQGAWKGPFDTATTMTVLPDDGFRTLLRAKIASNHWDGSLKGAYDIWNAVYAGTGIHFSITYVAPLQISIGISGSYTAIDLALLENGYLDLCPAGVTITGYTT